MDNKELMVEAVLKSFIGIKALDDETLMKRLGDLYLLGVAHGVDGLNDQIEALREIPA